MDDEIPPFLTVEEAGRLLRIGRTKAYDLAREWRATDGRSGLPVIDFGDLLRVPGPAIRRMLGVGLRADMPAVTKKPGEPAPVSPPEPPASSEGRVTPDPPLDAPASEGPVVAVPRKKARSHRALSNPTSQLPLFQPVSFTSPDPESPSRP
jgi:hypothetical protein